MLSFLLDAAKTSFITDALRYGLSPVLHFNISNPSQRQVLTLISSRTWVFLVLFIQDRSPVFNLSQMPASPLSGTKFQGCYLLSLTAQHLRPKAPHSVCLAGLHYCRNSLRKCKDGISSIFPTSIVLHSKSPQSVCQIRFYYVEKKYNLAVEGITSRVCLLGLKSQFCHLLAI